MVVHGPRILYKNQKQRPYEKKGPIYISLTPSEKKTETKEKQEANQKRKGKGRTVSK
jgi:hypothetical protein